MSAITVIWPVSIKMMHAKWGEDSAYMASFYDTLPRQLKIPARGCCSIRAEIEPLVKSGKNILIAAHGNSLRSLVMKLEGLSAAEILAVNIDTGVPYIYQMDDDAGVTDKMILAR